MENILAIDWRVLLIQIFGFVLLLVVFKVFLFKPLKDVMEHRREEIRANYEAAESEKAKMEQIRQDYERRMADIETEAREKINAAVKEGQAVRDDLLAEARQKAEEIMRRGEEELSRERDKTMQEIREEVVDIAIRAATKLIDQSLDEASHRRLVSGFINDLEVRK